MSGFRIGIFGGSFNPPHIGHIRALEKFRAAAEPNLLMVIPSFIPPHKAASEVGADKRLEMARLAFGKIGKNVQISDREILRGGKSYTYYTVEEIRAEYPGSEICLFVGSDMLMSFDTWYKAEELFKSCRLYVMPRQNDREQLEMRAAEYQKAFDADISFIGGEFYEISSTELRQAARNADSDFLAKNLSPEVFGYITRENLY